MTLTSCVVGAPKQLDWLVLEGFFNCISCVSICNLSPGQALVFHSRDYTIWSILPFNSSICGCSLLGQRIPVFPSAFQSVLVIVSGHDQPRDIATPTGEQSRLITAHGRILFRRDCICCFSSSEDQTRRLHPPHGNGAQHSRSISRPRVAYERRSPGNDIPCRRHQFEAERSAAFEDSRSVLRTQGEFLTSTYQLRHQVFNNFPLSKSHGEQENQKAAPSVAQP
jgi:hypothetical protein